MIRFISIVFSLFVIGSMPSVGQTLSPNDDESRITFKIKNFGATVEGSFKGLQGKIQFDPATLSKALFDVSIDPNTISTGIGLRDNHLRKKEYFDVKSYPLIKFISSRISTSSKPGEFIITGNLTIKDTTKEISFPFTYTHDNVFKGQFQIDRRDYDVGGNSISLADELTVYLSVVVRQE